MSDAPAAYKSAGIFMLISGIFTVLASLAVLASSLCMYCMGFLTLAAGIAEIVVGVAVMNGERRPDAKLIGILGLVSSLMICDIVGVVLEILAIVNLGKPEVDAWLAER